jgi:hypothetical protein
MEMTNPIKQSQCYSQCGWKCNTVCLESCEDIDDDLLCKINCGCTPSKKDIIEEKHAEVAPEKKAIITEVKETIVPIAKTAQTEATAPISIKAAPKATSLFDSKPGVDIPCNLECTNACLNKVSTKEKAVDCFIDCGCFPGFSAVELMQSTEASIIAHNSSGVLGYLLLAIFLVSIIVFTGWLVVDREEKRKGDRLSDVEASDNLMYEKLD